VRVFAALPLPPTALRSLSNALEPLRLHNPRLRWVSAEGLHVTLHFFGEIAEGAAAALKAIFEDPGLRVRAIHARLGAAGQFPPAGAPRVLWVGFEKGGGEMAEFWRLFQSKVAPLARFEGSGGEWLPDARGFTPHITVARCNRSSIDRRWREDLEIPREDFSLGECVLFQSILGRDGAHYVPLARAAFEGGFP
jgi:2'-5' RNA ligase